MQVSFSRIETAKRCPYKYELKYVSGYKTYPNLDDANNPLLIGSALHTGISQGVQAALDEYQSNYFIQTDKNIEEGIKLQSLIPKVQALLPKGILSFEVELCSPEFLGYIDLLVEKDDGTYAIYDFKYSNHIDTYKESSQIHVYKYYFEMLNPTKKVTELGYIFAPKTAIRLKKTESVEQFRTRLNEILDKQLVKIVKVFYNESKVKEFLSARDETLALTEFPKNKTELCRFCEFKEYCENGETYNMTLPKNERRVRDLTTQCKIWVYGPAYVGKTTFANAFPDPIFLNTDGNINSFDAPYVTITDTKLGKLDRLGWTSFTQTVQDLQNDTDYKTIVIDNIDDIYDMCRTATCKKLGISHESDTFGKAWDIVRHEFLSEMRKVANINKNIVLISHEDASKDITSRNGDKITAIKPSIPDKLANKLAGFVDITVNLAQPANAFGTGAPLFNFSHNQNLFAGARLKLPTKPIEATYANLLAIYNNQPQAVNTNTARANNTTTTIINK